MGKECKGGGGTLPHEPGEATRRGQAGKPAVNGSPDSCGSPSLIGVIDPSPGSLVLSCPVKKAF